MRARLAATFSGWSGASAVSKMRHPSDMCGEELGAACVAAAREQVESSKFWGLVSDRAVSLGSSLEPRDVSLLLNGLSRTRQLAHHGKLIEALEPVIIEKVAYFSSVQLAMTLSAIAKSFSSTAVPSLLIQALVKEVKARTHEFGTAVEFTMVLNALSKLGIVDSVFSQRLGAVILSKLRTGAVQFSARELCLIANGLSILGVREVTIFHTIATLVVSSAQETSPVELAKLMLALARLGLPVDKAVEASIAVAGPRFKYMSSADLVKAVFAFGSVCEFVDISANPSLLELFDLMNEAVIASLPLFQVNEIASVLASLSRWRVPVKSASELVQKLGFVTKRLACDDLVAVQIVGCLFRISTEENLLREFTESVLAVVSESIARTASPDWNAICRAVIACNELKLTNQQLLASLTQCVLNHRSSLDRHVALSLADSLVNCRIVSPAGDLILVLRDPFRC